MEFLRLIVMELIHCANVISHSFCDVQVDLKELQGRFLQQLQIMMRANMDGLKKRVRAKGKAKA